MLGCMENVNDSCNGLSVYRSLCTVIYLSDMAGVWIMPLRQDNNSLSVVTAIIDTIYKPENFLRDDRLPVTFYLNTYLCSKLRVKSLDFQCQFLTQ